MRVFISWSGDRSRRAAGKLYEWLKRVLPGQIDPWMSTEDLEPGGRWEEELDERLEETNAGICVLTPENLASTWLHYEAGAIGKAVGHSRVMTVLIGLSPADVPRPLGKFQHTMPTRDGVSRMVISLNKLMGEPIESSVVNYLFEIQWPWLEDSLVEITESAPAAALPRRSEYEMLEEILTLIRDLPRSPLALVVSRAITEGAPLAPVVGGQGTGKTNLAFLMPCEQASNWWPDLLHDRFRHLANPPSGRSTNEEGAEPQKSDGE
ncbi:toll/interleukin-1 receptor domain-containing protein [Geodermatophilus siccatus]|nr:TIR domain-containing protein [Geodermatophilus siccatus]